VALPTPASFACLRFPSPLYLSYPFGTMWLFDLFCCSFLSLSLFSFLFLFLHFIPVVSLSLAFSCFRFLSFSHSLSLFLSLSFLSSFFLSLFSLSFFANWIVLVMLLPRGSSFRNRSPDLCKVAHHPPCLVFFQQLPLVSPLPPSLSLFQLSLLFVPSLPTPILHGHSPPSSSLDCLPLSNLWLLPNP